MAGPLNTDAVSTEVLAWLRFGFFAWLIGYAAWGVAAPPPGDWWGTVTWVVDGDTVRVRPSAGGRPLAVRLDSIDAPELCQPGGLAARSAVQRQLMGQRVLVRGISHDRYRRMVARLTLNGSDPVAQLVDDGWVWSYQFGTGRGPYAEHQRRAEMSHSGLFASARPEEPGAFRKRHGPCPRPMKNKARG